MNSFLFNVMLINVGSEPDPVFSQLLLISYKLISSLFVLEQVGAPTVPLAVIRGSN
jgi:hypothetical protein